MSGQQKARIERALGHGRNDLRGMAFFKLFTAAAWARVVATNVFQRIAHRLLCAVVAVRAVHMAVIVMVVMIMVVIAVGTVDVGFLAHCRVTPE